MTSEINEIIVDYCSLKHCTYQNNKLGLELEKHSYLLSEIQNFFLELKCGFCKLIRKVKSKCHQDSLTVWVLWMTQGTSVYCAALFLHIRFVSACHDVTSANNEM